MAEFKKMADAHIDTVKASLPRVRISPQKLNLVADLIRNSYVSDAIIQLQFSKKRVACTVKKLLESAIANAENNNNMDIDSLYVKEVRIGRAMVMKRFRARARGRGARIIKPFSNIEIVLCERDEL